MEEPKLLTHFILVIFCIYASILIWERCNYFQLKIIIAVKNLEEESYYSFEVSATSVMDTVATSGRFSLEVPAYRRNRAISMGIIAGIGFLAAALGAIWWAKKKFCKNAPTEEKWSV